MKRVSLISQIQNMIQDYNGSIKYIISKELFKNLNNITHLTINKLSELTSCSKSSIVKYCKDLNLEGYKDLIRVLSYEASVFNIVESQPDITTKEKILFYQSKIEENFNYINQNHSQKFYEVVQLLNQGYNIFLFGKGPNINVCNIFHNYLIKLGYNTFFSNDLDVQLKLSSLVDEHSVVFIFSYSGLTRELIDIYQVAIINNSKIVFISSNHFSPMYEKQNVNIMTLNNEEILPNSRSSVISFTMIVMQIIYLLKDLS